VRKCCSGSQCLWTTNSTKMRCMDPAQAGLLGQSPQTGGGRVVLRPR
jgi:hypothetical protein